MNDGSIPMAARTNASISSRIVLTGIGPVRHRLTATVDADDLVRLNPSPTGRVPSCVSVASRSVLSKVLSLKGSPSRNERETWKPSSLTRHSQNEIRLQRRAKPRAACSSPPNSSDCTMLALHGARCAGRLRCGLKTLRKLYAVPATKTQASASPRATSAGRRELTEEHISRRRDVRRVSRPKTRADFCAVQLRNAGGDRDSVVADRGEVDGRRRVGCAGDWSHLRSGPVSMVAVAKPASLRTGVPERDRVAGLDLFAEQRVGLAVEERKPPPPAAGHDRRVAG